LDQVFLLLLFSLIAPPAKIQYTFRRDTSTPKQLNPSPLFCNFFVSTSASSVRRFVVKLPSKQHTTIYIRKVLHPCRIREGCGQFQTNAIFAGHFSVMTAGNLHYARSDSRITRYPPVFGAPTNSIFPNSLSFFICRSTVRSGIPVVLTMEGMRQSWWLAI